MATLITLPHDALHAVLRSVDVAGLLALSRTSKRLRTTVSERSTWIRALAAVYDAHGMRVPSAVFALPTDALAGLAQRPLRLQRAWAQNSPRPTACRTLRVHALCAGDIIAFLVIPGGEYAFVARSDRAAGTGAITLFHLDGGESAYVVAHEKFSHPVCCVDPQVGKDGASLVVLVDVEQPEIHVAHFVYCIAIPSPKHSAPVFVRAASLVQDAQPRFVSLCDDWIAMNLGGGELCLWHWKESRAVHLCVSDAETSDRWTINFLAPHIVIFDTDRGYLRVYALRERPSGAAPPLIDCSLTAERALPESWRGEMGLWQHGARLALPHSSDGILVRAHNAIVHVGVVFDKLMHCVLPDQPGTAPLCLTHVLPARFPRTADAVGVAGAAVLGPMLVSLLVTQGCVHAFSVPLREVGGRPEDMRRPALRASSRAGFRPVLTEDDVHGISTGLPAAIDPLSGRLVVLVDALDAVGEVYFAVADYA